MAWAYVLVTVDSAKSTNRSGGANKDPTGDFLKEALKLGYVKEAAGVHGVYDAVLKIEGRHREELDSRIREIKGRKEVTIATPVYDVSIRNIAREKSTYDM
jgi:DNA-binding Lrp family transcriptional regulator